MCLTLYTIATLTIEMNDSRDGLQKYIAAEISSVLSEVTVQIVYNIQRYNYGTQARNIITARNFGKSHVRRFNV
jgi:hypothetical protein